MEKAVAEASSDRSGVQEEQDAILEYLGQLKKRCVAKAETYAEKYNGPGFGGSARQSFAELVHRDIRGKPDKYVAIQIGRAAASACPRRATWCSERPGLRGHRRLFWGSDGRR